MLLKSSCLLLVLTVSQAFATSVNMLQLWDLEILESRQSGCPGCTIVSNTLSQCAASGAPTAIAQCACSSTVNSQVQACVNCEASANVGDVQGLVDTYNKLCKGTHVPTITNPGSGATGVPKKSSGTADKGKRAGVAAIGALVGAALVL